VAHESAICSELIIRCLPGQGVISDKCKWVFVLAWANKIGLVFGCEMCEVFMSFHARIRPSSWKCLLCIS